MLGKAIHRGNAYFVIAHSIHCLFDLLTVLNLVGFEFSFHFSVYRTSWGKQRMAS